MRSMIAALGLVGALFGAPALAAGEDVSGKGCEYVDLASGYYLDGDRKVFDEDKFPARTYKLDTPLFQNSTGDARSAQTVRFSQRLFVVDPGQGTGRIKVKDDNGQVIGWVNRNELLCKLNPLSDAATGLYRRAVVRTETAERGEVQVKKVYHSPDRRCEGGPSSCLEVSRFQWFFVYAEEDGHYLISADANLGSGTTRLLGWLPKEDAYGWNTALGLRPAEELAVRRGPNNSAEDYVCAYASLDDLNRAANCNEILGGKRWYGLNVRLAVLQEQNQTYEVIFSNAQSAGRDVAAPVEGLKRLDVFFVIDGTKSMGPAIDSVKKLVLQLRDHLKAKLSQGGTIRLGFHVYRDSIVGKGDGVENSEFLALSANSCGSTNEPEFNKAFDTVKAFEPEGDDDFPENSFAAMVKASEEVAPCPENAKLVFVIGDHGYDSDKQKSRGFQSYTEGQVASRFRKGSTRFPNNPPVVVFIQTPSEEAAAAPGSRIRYAAAYKAFKDQATSILKAVYAGTTITQPDEYFIGMQRGAISDAIVQRIDTYLNPDAIARIQSGLQAGQSLVEIIDGLRANNQLNIPIRYLQFVQEALCQRLGPQCRNKVFEGVNRAFVKGSDDLVPEVLLSRDQLDKWVKILDVFKTFGNRVRGREGRVRLADTLLADLGTVLQLDFENSPVPLGQRTQLHAGLPNGARSKLLQYSSEELARDIPACEVEYLVQYSAKKHDALNIVYGSDGKLVPTFDEARQPEGNCPNLSDKGKSIPFISDVRPRPLNSGSQQTDLSLMHKKGNDFWFWLPVRYLP